MAYTSGTTIGDSKLTAAANIAAAKKTIAENNIAGLAALEKYKQLPPNSPEAKYQYATAQAALSRIKNAESSLKSWQELDSNMAKFPQKLPPKESISPPAPPSPGVAAVGSLVETRIAKLPTIKSPEIVKKQIEAEIQDKKVQLDTILQLAKQEAVDTAKAQLKEGFAGLLPKLPTIPKLPILDPKFIAQLAYARAKQEVSDFRQKLSKENLKKSKEAFTFPMKPQLTIPTMPKIPELPKLPDIKLPQLPTVKLPSIPPIPKIPQLPEFPKLPAVTLPTIPKVTIPQIKDISIPSATDIKNIKISNIKLP